MTCAPPAPEGQPGDLAGLWNGDLGGRLVLHADGSYEERVGCEIRSRGRYTASGADLSLEGTRTDLGGATSSNHVETTAFFDAQRLIVDPLLPTGTHDGAVGTWTGRFTLTRDGMSVGMQMRTYELRADHTLTVSESDSGTTVRGTGTYTLDENDQIEASIRFEGLGIERPARLALVGGRAIVDLHSKRYYREGNDGAVAGGPDPSGLPRGAAEVTGTAAGAPIQVGAVTFVTTPGRVRVTIWADAMACAVDAWSRAGRFLELTFYDDGTGTPRTGPFRVSYADADRGIGAMVAKLFESPAGCSGDCDGVHGILFGMRGRAQLTERTADLARGSFALDFLDGSHLEGRFAAPACTHGEAQGCGLGNPGTAGSAECTEDRGGGAWTCTCRPATGPATTCRVTTDPCAALADPSGGFEGPLGCCPS